MVTDDSDTPHPEPGTRNPEPDSGDRTGARRMRWSFRLCVMAILTFATALWVSDRYLRYDLTESQYIMALTHYPESARAILRQVVKRDAEERKFPTPKYVAALAEREEADLVLPTYEKAYKLDPSDPALALRYGCRLFQAGRYAEARERFREAATGLWPAGPGDAPSVRNLLPEYLEATTLAPWNEAPGSGSPPDPNQQPETANQKPPTDEAFSESLALVAKTNASFRGVIPAKAGIQSESPVPGSLTEPNRKPETGNQKLLFPRPLWSENLPERGVWYSRLRRQIADECCAPLYKYTDLVINQAKHQIALRQATYWGPWLEAIQTMGSRLTFAQDAGSIQATAGIRIQLAALELSSQLTVDSSQSSVLGSPTTDNRQPMTEKANGLRKALHTLDAFEAARDDRIGEDRARFILPLKVCWQSVAVLFLSYGFAYLVSRILRVKRQAWAVPHPRWGRRLLLTGTLQWFACLLVMALLQHQPPFAPQAINDAAALGRFFAGAAWVILTLMLAFGLVYPALTLSRFGYRGLVFGSMPTTDPTPGTRNPKPGTRSYRIAYAALMRRYYGILCGTIPCLIAFWAILYRVLFSLYPWQIELLVTGLEREEAQVVYHVLSLLH